MLRFRVLFALIITAGLIGSQFIQGAITPEQQKKVIATANALNNMDALIKAGKFDDALKLLPTIQDAATELAAIPELAKPVETLIKRIDSARGNLELQGMTLPDFVKPAKPGNKPDGKNPAGNAPAAGGVSFVKQVAPFLVAKCGNCHVTGSRGQLNFASYEVLTKGFNGKLMIIPGDSKGSDGLREIESGNMPRGGLKVTPDEAAMFKKWIDEGAKFDGTDAKQPLNQLSTVVAAAKNAPAAPKMPAEPKLEAMAATGRETVSFARDIAPILVSQCYDCHGAAQQVQGGLGMDNFTQLIKGGDSGNPFVPGKPADSLLVKKIKGTAGDRMPKGRKPLSDKEIGQFDKWVAEGAKFDAGDLNLSLGTMVAMVKALDSSHSELQKDRDERAKVNWKMAIPDDIAGTVESKNFIVIGNVGDAMLKQISELAEAQVTLMNTQFKLDDSKPAIKGRATLYAMKRRFEYSEWKSIEDREIPTALHGHIRHTVIDAYGVLWVPADDKEFSLKTLVNEQVAGLVLADMSKGKMPSWLAGGIGRALAAKNDARDPRVKAMDDGIGRALGAVRSVAEISTGKVGGENGELVAYGFGKYLVSNQTKFAGFVTALSSGTDMETALSRNLGGNTMQLLSTWSGKGATAKP
jgi:hypothetical protein